MGVKKVLEYSCHDEVLEDNEVEYDWIVAPREIPVLMPRICEC